MSLSSVFQIAQNSLSAMTRRTAVVSRNINDAANPDYSRRDLQTITAINGSQTLLVRRAADAAIEKASLAALSKSSGQTLLSGQLETLNGLLAGESGGLQIQDRLTALHGGLQTLSANPGNITLAQTVISDATALASSIRFASTEIQAARSAADDGIQSLVTQVEALLDEFKLANDIVRQGSEFGQDVNDALDRRAAVLKQISEIVPISAYVRSHNDMVLMTTSGVTLFETNPRTIDFTKSSSLAAATSGSSVHIDFVRIDVSAGSNAEASGKLDALIKLRDEVLPSMQRQLDEFAHGLIASFSETDASAILAPMQGLFAWTGGPAIPSDGILTDGMSGSIFVNPLYDPQQGGDIWRLRDGGANGLPYVANPTGAASFSGRLIELLENMDENRQFSPSSGLATEATVVTYAGQMNAWFSAIRSTAESSAGIAETRNARFSEQVSNAVGVNIDDEMILLGQLEQSYAASSRLLQAADQMLKDLLAAVG